MSHKNEKNPKTPLVTGYKQVIKAAKAGELRLIYLAGDCEPRLKDAVAAVAQEAGVPVSEEHSMAQLGLMSEIDVGAATVGVRKDC